MNGEMDMKTVLAVVALIAVGWVVYNNCQCSCNKRENLEVRRVPSTGCSCGGCERKCYELATTGSLYGCNPHAQPYSPELCELSYRKCALHGCGRA